MWRKGRQGAVKELPVVLVVLVMLCPLLAASESTQGQLLSLLVPWAEDDASAPTGAIENLGEAPYLESTADDARLQAFLQSGRVPGARSGDWEAPRSPDLFLLTEARPRGARRALDDTQQEVASRKKRDGGVGFVSGGSRVRTGGIGGGFAGSAGMRVGNGGAFGSGGRGLSPGTRMNEGPSLSIVNPLDVLRQRLLLEIARRRMRESEDQIQANRELLKSIGKREADDSSPGGGADDDDAAQRTPSSM